MLDGNAPQEHLHEDMQMQVQAMASMICFQRSVFVTDAPLISKGISIVSMHRTARRTQAVLSRHPPQCKVTSAEQNGIIYLPRVFV